MRRQLHIVFIAIAACSAGMAGCKSTESTTEPAAPASAVATPKGTGFLSTYSRLEPAGETSLRYLDPNNRLARYDKFTIYPVELRMYEGTEGHGVPVEKQRMLQQYMHDALVRVLQDGYEVVDAPAWDVAEVHVALTDIKQSTPILNVIPRLKLMDVGLGGMSMEMEVLDSVSHVQITALVESQTGRNLSIDFTQFDDAKGAMDDWASRFRRVVDEAHAQP